MAKGKKTILRNEFFSHLEAMEGGDVIMITKRPGGKWIITSVVGDGYTTTGCGETFEEAWEREI